MKDNFHELENYLSLKWKEQNTFTIKNIITGLWMFEYFIQNSIWTADLFTFRFEITSFSSANVISASVSIFNSIVSSRMFSLRSLYLQRVYHKMLVYSDPDNVLWFYFQSLNFQEYLFQYMVAFLLALENSSILFGLF